MSSLKQARRKVLRTAVLFAFGAVLGKFDILKAAPSKPPLGRGPGQLTVDLSQWGGIIFTHKGKSVTVSMKEVFDALESTPPARSV